MVVTGTCGPEEIPFWPPRFSNGPFFYLKIGLDIGSIFSKYFIIDEFSFSLPKVVIKYLCIPIYKI